jgi:hypothetical protein
MIVNRHSWHYKLYQWSYLAYSHYPSSSTDICNYVLRIALMVPFQLLTIGLLYVGFALFIVIPLAICISPLMFLIGYRPCHPFTAKARKWNRDYNRITFIDHVPYPKFNLFGLRFYPWQPLLILLGVGGLVLLWWYNTVLAIIVSLLALIICAICFVALSEAKTARWIKIWFAALKQQVCLPVEFEDKER